MDHSYYGRQKRTEEIRVYQDDFRPFRKVLSVHPIQLGVAYVHGWCFKVLDDCIVSLIVQSEIVEVEYEYLSRSGSWNFHFICVVKVVSQFDAVNEHSVAVRNSCSDYFDAGHTVIVDWFILVFHEYLNTVFAEVDVACFADVGTVDDTVDLIVFFGLKVNFLFLRVNFPVIVHDCLADCRVNYQLLFSLAHNAHPAWRHY